MKPLALTGFLVATILLSTTAIHADEPPIKGKSNGVANTHASLQAYSGGIITLKDADSGMFFYVETNGRRLVGFDSNGKIEWITDILPLGKKLDGLIVGQPVVRHLRIENARLVATYAKGGNACLNLKTGRIDLNMVR